MQLLKEAGQSLLHLLYPRLCDGCHTPLHLQETGLCLHCRLLLPVTAYHSIADNETANRFAGRLPFQYATSYLYFTDGGIVQHLLHGLKYRNRQETGVELGRLFGQDLKTAGWSKNIDCLVPVPLHTQKEAKRGYNQSALLAKGMEETLDIPAIPTALRRIRHTESQTHKTRAERAQNVANAFEVVDEKAYRDKHVLVLDDVLTTGATLEACAQAILSVPGTKVSFATLAIAND